MYTITYMDSVYTYEYIAQWVDLLHKKPSGLIYMFNFYPN